MDPNLHCNKFPRRFENTRKYGVWHPAWDTRTSGEQGMGDSGAGWGAGIIRGETWSLGNSKMLSQEELVMGIRQSHSPD